jgi:adenylate cyclase
MGPIPVGVGIHTGEAYVGTVGTEGAVTDFTALGDAVNTTARLVAQAAAGELTASVAAATAAGLDVTDLERRTVEIRGRTEPLEIVVLGAAA